jgi:hypothetical protein
MFCKSSTKQWVNQFKQCERCGCSWPRSYGHAPVCFYEDKKRIKQLNEHAKIIRFENTSHLEFSHDLKLDNRRIV